MSAHEFVIASSMDYLRRVLKESLVRHQKVGGDCFTGRRRILGWLLLRPLLYWCVFVGGLTGGTEI